jgi:hypothetical protein
MDKLKEAYEVIDEWGLNEDDFIAQNFKQFMSGDSFPDDNSIELSNLYRGYLKIIVDFGLKEAKIFLDKVDALPLGEGSNKRFAEGFKRGQESVKRKNKSGCVCIIDDNDNVVSPCGAHLQWKESD